MTRLAAERMTELFALAETEAASGSRQLPDRYVGLARKIGMRYNVRLPPEYRELYCRGCSVYWVEGRTVRTRLRSGRRVRTCLACGRVRRVPVRSKPIPANPDLGSPAAGRAVSPQLGELPTEVDDEAAEDSDESL